MGNVFGDKNDPPYAEEKIPDRWLIYEPEIRAASEMEEILINLLVEAEKPLSQTQFRDACTACGDAKQKKMDELTVELHAAKKEAFEATVKYEKLTQHIGGAANDD